MRFDNLRRVTKERIVRRWKGAIDSAEESDESFKETLERYGRQYKGTKSEQMTKFKRFIVGRAEKEWDDRSKYLALIEEADEFSTRLVITVEWKRSYTWGSNPTASTNFGFVGSSIGGCGYCKMSTATAQGLNSDYRILKILCQKVDDFIGKHGDIVNNRELLGYGSGYHPIPRFEGGVGVSSHQTILERIGLRMDNVTSTSGVDVYVVEKTPKNSESSSETKDNDEEQK